MSLSQTPLHSISTLRTWPISVQILPGLLLLKNELLWTWSTLRTLALLLCDFNFYFIDTMDLSLIPNIILCHFEGFLSLWPPKPTIYLSFFNNSSIKKILSLKLFKSPLKLGMVLFKVLHLISRILWISSRFYLKVCGYSFMGPSYRSPKNSSIF